MMSGAHTMSISAAVREFDVLRVADHERGVAVDHVAVELPLEVRLNGAPFSVIMCTPGDDHHLALGFLLTESVIAAKDDVASVDVDDDGDAVNVTLVAAKA